MWPAVAARFLPTETCRVTRDVHDACGGDIIQLREAIIGIVRHQQAYLCTRVVITAVADSVDDFTRVISGSSYNLRWRNP